MNMDDEDEYVDFYDFSKTYQNHPLMIREQNEVIDEGEPEDEDDEKKKGKKGDGSDSEWDDCDLESMDSKEAAAAADEVQEQVKDDKISDQKESSSFSEIDIPSADKDMGVESLSSLTSGEKEKTKH